jgi:hypothetical protein
MSDPVIVALITATPPTMVALGALWNTRRNRDTSEKVLEQVTPSNGTPTAKIVEQIQAELRELRKADEAATHSRGAIRSDLRAVKDDIAYHITVQHGRGPVADESKED